MSPASLQRPGAVVTPPTFSMSGTVCWPSEGGPTDTATTVSPLRATTPAMIAFERPVQNASSPTPLTSPPK